MAAKVANGAWAALCASARRECAFLRTSPWDIALVGWLPWLLLAVVMFVLGASVLRDVPIAVVDDDASGSSRELIRQLDAAPGIYVRTVPASLAEAWSQIRALDVYAVVHIPRDATRRMARGEAGTLFAFYNASYLTIGQSASRDIGAVVQAHNAQAAVGRGKYLRGASAISAVPVQVQSTVLFNPARSYEHFLGGLLLPAILQLALCLAVVAALGRELRDGTAGAWLDACGGRLLPAVIGKVAPYLVLFTVYGALAVVWVAYLRGDGVAGSFAMLAGGYLAMYLAYAAIGLLLVGLTRNMATALSLSGMYAGVSLAFSGSTFPVIEASTFAQVWSRLLPYTAYVKLQAQQIDIGSPFTVSLWQIGAMLLFVVVAGIPGFVAFGRAARDPASWGQR